MASIILAAKTLKAVEDAIAADGGNAFRMHLREIMPKIEDAYREEPVGKLRSHLGVSRLGRECAFELWLGFRWAYTSKFSGRMLRLFNRGHLEEGRFIAMLLAAGFQVWYEKEDGGQFTFSGLGGHFGSAMDAIVAGLPDVPNGEPAYGEFKTHNEKSFAKLAGPKPAYGEQRKGGDGVLHAKFDHYVQIQVGMHFAGVKYGFYLAVNKDTDELHAEVLEYDVTTVTRYLQRAETLVFAEDGVPRLSEQPGWWKCKFCDAKELCHGNDFPLVNCRTCAHATPERDGSWSCALGCGEVKECPQEGCQHHVYNPHTMAGVKVLRMDKERNAVVFTRKGETIANGPNDTTSRELAARNG